MVAGAAKRNIAGAVGKDRWLRHLVRSSDMGGTRLLFQRVLITALLAGCGGSMATAPGGGPPEGGGGGGSGGGPVARSVTVTAGNNFFKSDRNGSANPAVDTVVAGGKVSWKWANTGSVPHNVQSVGMPSFT